MDHVRHRSNLRWLVAASPLGLTIGSGFMALALEVRGLGGAGLALFAVVLLSGSLTAGLVGSVELCLLSGQSTPDDAWHEGLAKTRANLLTESEWLLALEAARARGAGLESDLRASGRRSEHP